MAGENPIKGLREPPSRPLTTASNWPVLAEPAVASTAQCCRRRGQQAPHPNSRSGLLASTNRSIKPSRACQAERVNDFETVQFCI